MIVRSIMTDKPVFLEAHHSIRQAMHALYQHEIRHLPIVDQGRLVGMLSDRDLRSYSLPAAEVIGRGAEVSKRLDAPVSSIMHGDVLSVGPDAEVSDAIDMMIRYKVGAVPVQDLETCKLIGIVSYVDILKAAKGVL